MISQKQKEGKSCRCFRLLSKTFSLSSRKQRDDDDESAGRNVPVLLPLPSCLSYAEKRKEKDRIKLEKFKNVRLLLVGKPQQQTLFDTTRSSRICCISRSSKRSRAMHRQRCVRNAPCSTSSSPWSRLGRIGSGQNRCFVTSTPPRRRARSPSLATRTRWRCTQSSHR